MVVNSLFTHPSQTPSDTGMLPCVYLPSPVACRARLSFCVMAAKEEEAPKCGKSTTDNRLWNVHTVRPCVRECTAQKTETFTFLFEEQTPKPCERARGGVSFRARVRMCVLYSSARGLKESKFYELLANEIARATDESISSELDSNGRERVDAKIKKKLEEGKGAFAKLIWIGLI